MKLRSLIPSIILLFTLVTSSAVTLAAPTESSATLAKEGIIWPVDEHAGATLVITGPGGTVLEQSFGPDAPLGWYPADQSPPLADGSYDYELRVYPALSAEAQARLEAASSSPDRGTVVAQLEAEGLIAPPAVTWGSLQIEGGMLYVPIDAAEPLGGKTSSASRSLSDAKLTDQVILDDLIVDGSLCVGFDCVENEVFGFDTLILKENNLRIFFNDTSVTSSFPFNDWGLEANASQDGGQSHFAMLDRTAGTVPFKLRAGARDSALLVDPDSQVGMGTSVPVADLHVVVSDSPTMRLEQDSSLFSQQVWDIGGNEHSFFVRDQSGLTSAELSLAPSGQLSVTINTMPTMLLDTNGNLTLGGALRESSDIARKENLQAVDAEDVLAKVNSLPVYTWNYIGDAETTRHMGPIAQDMYAAFGLGEDDQHISPLDVNGAALAAVQALTDRVAEQDATIESLAAEKADLEDRVSALEALVADLAAAKE